ncbi:MAG: hemerythrin domain-containing protein [bacterium]|nr:hemerythrin domain-containing protein [bacterium]
MAIMKPTEILRKEHDNIKVMLEIFERLVFKLEATEGASLEHVEQALNYLELYVGKCHFGKEEELFYPALEKIGIPKDGGPLGAMIQEHDSCRVNMKEMRMWFEKYKTGDHTVANNIVKPGHKYVITLRTHFDTEANILFPMADKGLLAGKQDELAMKFEQYEITKIGAGTHETLHQSLAQLKGIYLV